MAVGGGGPAPRPSEAEVRPRAAVGASEAEVRHRASVGTSTTHSKYGTGGSTRQTFKRSIFARTLERVSGLLGIPVNPSTKGATQSVWQFM
ncbi:hypothetical protein PVAP13_3KG403502 [Panicum virgatum]|uniref:Uncharacterized protein n=1 Tax=Panicum virgatum TaxID=38727 RepID=A0A8T0V6B4_PANVG|nr:hypothetical protein PVAP13_3KG403502 [Panicum virgatum]